MNPTISIIDYGASNLLNVVRAMEHCNAKIKIIDKPEQIAKAQALLLPGVGAFPKAMEVLTQKNYIPQIHHHAKSGKPLLGICLGMQMLLDKSTEHGETKGLSLIPGQVIAIPPKGTNNIQHKIPHIGWNELLTQEDTHKNTLLQHTKPKSAVYFVHSYMAKLENEHQCLAYTLYDGVKIPAIIQKDNIIGCQFHPEKSGETGLTILKNFIQNL